MTDPFINLPKIKISDTISEILWGFLNVCFITAHFLIKKKKKEHLFSGDAKKQCVNLILKIDTAVVLSHSFQIRLRKRPPSGLKVVCRNGVARL